MIIFWDFSDSNCTLDLLPVTLFVHLSGCIPQVWLANKTISLKIHSFSVHGPRNDNLPELNEDSVHSVYDIRTNSAAEHVDSHDGQHVRPRH